ncbi:Major structural phage protein, partial [Streptomyces sp. NRRL F-6602]
MAVTLPEAAKLSTTQLQRGVVETFVQESSILDRIPFLTIEGNAYAYNEEGTLPGVSFRAVNEAYTESTGTVNQKSESLVILGGDADVDRFIVKTR